LRGSRGFAPSFGHGTQVDPQRARYARRVTLMPTASSLTSRRTNEPCAERRPTSVLIVIVSYRTGPLVARSLSAIEQERHREKDLSLRVIVVDNASGDAPGLERLVAQKNWQDWATVIASPANGGFAYGNNVAFRHAYESGEVPDFFYLLNPDAEVLPGAIHEL